VSGPQLPVFCQPKKHQAWVQRQQFGADICADLRGCGTFLTNLANKGTAIHILKTLTGHRSISTTAA
jgi:hypothetical protein